METGLQNEERRAHGESEDVSNKSYYVTNDSNDESQNALGKLGQNSQSPRGDHSPALMNESPPRASSPTADGDYPSPHSSVADINSKAMLIPPQLSLSPEEVLLLHRASRFPPVTADSLSELGLDAIMKNTQLRMDVNFDKDLHFRPVGGPAKAKMTNDYWQAIAIEISIFNFGASNSINLFFGARRSSSCQVFQARLPNMLDALREILLTLVPDRDRVYIKEHLDTKFLMTQVEKGVLNLVRLAEWLAILLKTHCAPMRDHMSDDMVEHIRNGCQFQDMNEVSKGLHQLFAILESMKLDVANHQIRAFRLYLIEDSVEYLRKHYDFFIKKSMKSSSEAQNSKIWYFVHWREFHTDSEPVHNDFESAKILFEALSLNLCSFCQPPFPDSFALDFDRLCNIRTNIETFTLLRLCCQAFTMVVNGDVSAALYYSLQSRILSILQYDEHTPHENDVSGHSLIARFEANTPSIALEIARMAHMMKEGSSLVTCPDTRVIHFISDQLSPRNRPFEAVRQCVQRELKNIAVNFASQYWHMTALDIADSQQFEQRSDYVSWPQVPDIQCLGKRLAHIGVLHWRIWAPLLYYPGEGGLSGSRFVAPGVVDEM
ncbi:hypothetical protein RJZ56_002295 [Blastomyces dermatitidis]|uniref:cAMP-mediated signaling protein Sok1 n=1 Tax=Ajellomyces dermatitidis (strain ER-3 / ATCC MYA-2586) TaxID=559297 RepID=A0ABX2VTI7_AJEDR|nr:cAMP-mediated signaling protein Sok1 [Blastomyces dermatitidis ER-3]XP_045280227.1 cAMP-mediated signaling protein Sok1, variant 1 [Blastomyces dermatitidis ER-3]XP_045280228.1 cAMP-mediated signaling protein Sok1, variant 2 [Blastomyces dermatitidis ER-3]XP_045280229.1 cAMP-mediated signaling protein Sok1, variant 3 [Blastomyces dermatitidis ER-3]EEQ87804.1 cAMP-mediated signaling protein Sok1 [Blastomyces dermatitidis ER-3]OAT00500.1 cAMP-mediated signaling protein Sok1, variant 1 [Blasto